MLDSSRQPTFNALFTHRVRVPVGRGCRIGERGRTAGGRLRGSRMTRQPSCLLAIPGLYPPCNVPARHASVRAWRVSQAWSSVPWGPAPSRATPRTGQSALLVIIGPMTDRGLPIVDGAPACPFVAFEDDRDGRGQAPDHRHRCFAEPRPAPRALAHQEAYCLSSAFPVCPTFQDWARREAATARAAQLEADVPEFEEPVSQSLPPRELEARHAPSTDTPPPLPPRRNPPRAWADPPPWADDEDGERAEPPSFLAARPPEPSDQRAAEAAAWGAASRGLAGSAADRLAGGYVDDADEPVAPSPAAYEAASYAAPRRQRPERALSTPGQGRRRGGIGRRVRGGH